MSGMIGLFAQHRVAANLLMVIMLLAGLLSLQRMNLQIFPNFELDVVSVRTLWSGASAEDVELGITIPLEQRLRSLDHLKEMTSTSATGISSISLEFDEGTDMSFALDEIRKQVDDFTNLPGEAEQPRVAQAARYESIARLLVSGPAHIDELRSLARQFERQLLTAGIDKIDIEGLPERQLQIEVGAEQMRRLQTDLNELARRIDNESQDLPAGMIGEEDGSREIRGQNQRRSPQDFAGLEIDSRNDRRILLGDIAGIREGYSQSSETISKDGRQAVVLVLRRTETGDSLEAARILDNWLAETRPTLPPSIEIEVFNERWQYLRDRIRLLLENGAGGLVLVLIILYLFLSARVAFWVAVGIPVSFMATIAVLHLSGGTINMISLFALIMALGIIVDDAIVVGEDAQAHFDQGEDPLTASEGGARRMLAPVMASSLTTIAAFMPLMLVGGRMGAIMYAIPLVIVCTIIASLIESFMILPGHLRHAFVAGRGHKQSRFKSALDRGFLAFRERFFRRLVRVAIEFRWTTIAVSVAFLLLAAGLFLGGKVGWQFFPSPDSTTVNATVRFVSGTSRDVVDRFMDHVEDRLRATMAELDEPVVSTYYRRHAAVGRSGAGNERTGALYVELVDPDQRRTDNRAFIRAWRAQLQLTPGIENFQITARRFGPSRRDLTLRLTSNEADRLKAAALDLAQTMESIPGVSAIEDDQPFGREQLIYELNPAGEAMGLSISDIGRQLRAAYDGIVLQRFQQGADEVEVRLQLPESESRRLDGLPYLPIRLPNGEFVALESVADWRSAQGFETLRHFNGTLSVDVSADVDPGVNSIVEIVADLQQSTLPQLAARYGVQSSIEGRSASQREAFADLRTGAMVALLLMYLVLAWVFSSYGWPFLVMFAIPLGLTGAVLGHWAMGMNMTLLSMFGFFGLSGIVVNNSIILVIFYRRIREGGMALREALEEAACQRLRAVLLTSLTTIAGLTPLLFETSRQAQFLIPMAVSIAFGLAFATLLILLVIPALLSIYEDVRLWLGGHSEGVDTRPASPGAPPL